MEERKNAGERAVIKYKEGYNCAETILRAFRDELKLDLSDDSMKIATGFGGGLGQAGCMCGALTGAVMVLSLLQGRTSSAVSRDPAYNSARDFHQAFSDAFGASCCRVLNPHEFGALEQRKNCLKITARTADLLEQFLHDKGLVLQQP